MSYIIYTEKDMSFEQQVESFRLFHEKNLHTLLLSKGFEYDQLCLAIEAIFTHMEYNGFYIKVFELKIPLNDPIKINWLVTNIRPDNYSYKNISFFFLRVVNMARAIGNLLITRIKFEEGKEDVEIGLTEIMDRKTCAFDLKETGIKDDFESYFGSDTKNNQ